MADDPKATEEDDRETPEEIVRRIRCDMNVAKIFPENQIWINEAAEGLLSEIIRLRDKIGSLTAELDGATHNRFYDQRDGYFEGLADGKR